MALTLNDIILGARGAHPAFHKTLVPDASFARFLTGYQRELTAKALERDQSFLAQQMAVGFDLSTSNRVGTVGAGVGGRPIDADVGILSVVNEPVGTAAEVDVDGSDVVTLVSESVVASATSTTLTKTAAGWTVNAYSNYTVVILSGTGAGQRRTVSSNTATVLTVSQAWTTNPDTTSTFVVVDEVLESDKQFGAVASAPFTASRVGYLVKVNSTGTAYLDYTTPLVAKYDVGIPLPQMHALIGGTVRFTTDATETLTLVGYESRHDPRAPFAAYVMGNELFLCGGEAEWTDITSLDLRYVPVPPALTALTSTLLLPDMAYTALVNGAAFHAGLRVNGLPDVPKVDVNALALQKAESELAFLRNIGRGKRNRFAVIKEWSGY